MVRERKRRARKTKTDFNLKEDYDEIVENFNTDFIKESNETTKDKVVDPEQSDLQALALEYEKKIEQLRKEKELEIASLKERK